MQVNTIEEQLARFGAGDTMTADDAVRGDVRRARTALRRRRARRVSVGSLAAVGVLAVGSLATSSLVQAPTGSGPVAQGPSSSAGSAKLVAYSGAQAPGYVVKTVPAGFAVRDDYHPEGALVMAREDDTSATSGFQGKIVASLTNAAYDSFHGRNEQQVSVNGRPGIIWETPESTPATRLTYQYDDSGRTVDLQVWNGIDLTRQQIVQLAEGITVTAAATTSVS